MEKHVDQIKPIHGKSENEALLKVVCEVLRKDPLLKPSSDIEVEVRGAEVILSGEIPYRQDKAHIENLVRNTRGVVKVINDLKVSSDRLSKNTVRNGPLQRRLRDIRVGTLHFNVERQGSKSIF